LQVPAPPSEIGVGAENVLSRGSTRSEKMGRVDCDMLGPDKNRRGWGERPKKDSVEWVKASLL
jgi:hypothetical protein